MKYGFVIDNRKCIGCHACTTACKSEHEVPVGVNRTWVKQVEQGEFPDTRRLFSVMRCNQCTDAPCVPICPTESLFIRKDGIVDFDKDRCIGCKSCMQACPYDALYIDPETHTAAKCNYCAHRIDLGLEPACVNVCPEEAIISGDMENASSPIAILLKENETKVRRPEAGTKPNVFYIDAQDVSLVATATEPSSQNLWGSQAHGVGHFAKEAEKLAFSNTDLVAELVKINGGYETNQGKVQSPKTVEVLMNKSKQVYNTPDKGILWGWEVSAYVWTKAIAAGMILVPFLALITNLVEVPKFLWSAGAMTALFFLTITGLLLIMDLDQPKRFAYVLLRPHWKSWLVKGGYAIAVFGLLLSLVLLSQYFEWFHNYSPIYILTALTAGLVAVYTAFLFAQAKGREFWQSKNAMALHMLVHAFMAGAALYFFFTIGTRTEDSWMHFLRNLSVAAILINLVIIFYELYSKHDTVDAKRVVNMIRGGEYKNMFWIATILIGNVFPLIFLLLGGITPLMGAIAGLCMLTGIYFNNHIWVEAPQKIPLS